MKLIKKARGSPLPSSRRSSGATATASCRPTYNDFDIIFDPHENRSLRPTPLLSQCRSTQSLRADWRTLSAVLCPTSTVLCPTSTVLCPTSSGPRVWLPTEHAARQLHGGQDRPARARACGAADRLRRVRDRMGLFFLALFSPMSRWSGCLG